MLPFAIKIGTVLKSNPDVSQGSLTSVYEYYRDFVPRWSMTKLKCKPNQGLLPNEFASITENADVWIVSQCFGNETDNVLIPTTANPSADRFIQGIMNINREEHWRNSRHGMEMPNVPNNTFGLHAECGWSTTKVNIGRAVTEGSHCKEIVAQLHLC
jgi:hypothetical protein